VIIDQAAQSKTGSWYPRSDSLTFARWR